METKRIRLKALDELVLGRAEVLLHEGPPPWRSIILVLLKDGPRAYWNVCQHLPVPLDGGSLEIGMQGPEMVCSTHGARFRCTDGFCTSGPCLGQVLRVLPLEVVDGEIFAEVGSDGGPTR